ncbi:dihydrolipoyl dehydrogenase [Hydrogenibacillus sp. N12]|uniref:dihydrolipoyl dehydrogenase n=1 Tax=Hydrogenibacillus sp. N12 TaxID=2866627 RepID=UPI001C7D35D2|nr:dihydrolipoyl dehydrogenase [Hydrogenibacillus sp. N12]QZA34076.1 dihydrolipoyl dehydrogenase [Hydrogenibacillus sp. N12]
MVVGETTLEADVVVIGAGPGGYVAALRAARFGRKVTLIERDAVGGVCLNVGCIPSKALIAAAHDLYRLRQGAAYGLSADVRLDFPRLIAWKDGVVRTLTGGVEKLLKGNGVELLFGEAFFTGPRELRLLETGGAVMNIRFRAAIVATGSRPATLSGFPFGSFGGRVISSTEALSLKEVPERLVILGGGVIGVELGQAYARFGSRVTIVEAAERILPAFEADLLRPLRRRLQAEGIELLERARAIGAAEGENGLMVQVETPEGERELAADYVLVAVGRRPNTDALGLEAAGVQVDGRGYIAVNDRQMTNVEGIYAVGDVVPGLPLAHKATAEGKVAAEAIAEEAGAAADFRAVPMVVYSDPEVATVGMTAAEAEAAGFRVKVGMFPLAANGRALTLGEKDGFVRLVGDAETGALLGAQVVGPGASELIAELALAVEMGIRVEDLALTVHAHPTFAEAAMEAADVWLGKPVHVLGKLGGVLK